MKKTILMMAVIAILLSLMASAASAALLEFGYYEKTGTFSDEVSVAVEPGTAWIASLTTGTTLTTRANVTGSIVGNFAGGNIWQASYSVDNGATYKLFANMLNGWSQTYTKLTTKTGDAELIDQPINESITNIKLGYSFTLINANAGGTANYEVTSVPEPSTMLAILSILSPVGMLMRRRKA